MASDEKWMQIIYSAIDERNAERGSDPLIEKSPETVLFGKAGQLDSLELVSTIISIEQKVQDDSGTSVTISDDRAISRSDSPFRTVSTLASYIEELVQEETSG